MASQLTTSITLSISAEVTDPAVVRPDSSSPKQSISYSKNWAWANGNAAANQADRLFTVSDVIVNNATPKTYDLNAGGLLDIIGNAVNFSKITGIIMISRAANAGEIITVGAGSNPLLNWIIATGDGNKIGPGGVLKALDPSLAAYAVTPTTGDILTLTLAAGSNVPFDLFIFGRS